MMKIAKSLAMIAFVAAIGVYATSSFFSDTETSVDNTFTAGTIDIDIDGDNPFEKNFNIGDLKPGEVGYINFKINNVGQNPVDVSKSLYNFKPTDSNPSGYHCVGTTGGTPYDYYTSSEPECVAEAGTPKDDVETQILYDLSVKVYATNDEGVEPTWYQTIYAVDGNGDKSLTEVYGDNNTATNFVKLGMIPVGGHMLVTQSYHFNANARNEYQGDGLKFDMEILGEQLTGEDGVATVTLENKTKVGDEWIINSTDGFVGTLKYETNGPEFVYSFSGRAPSADKAYVLAIGMKANGAGFDVDTEIARGTTNGDGDLTLTGSTEINKDMMGVKAWLVPAENWKNPGMEWGGISPWPTCMSNFLWETSLVWYNDTDEN